MIGMILCGGYGRRLKPYTDSIPAPLIEIRDNYTILDKQLFDFAAAGIRDVVLLTGYKSEMIQARYGEEYKGIKVHYYIEKKPAGTLNAIKGGMKFADDNVEDPVDDRDISDTFLVRNGDIVADVNLRRLIQRHENSRFCGTLFVTRMRSPFGIVELGDDRVKSFREKPTLDYYINGGVYCLNRDLPFDRFEGGSIEQTIFPLLAEEGKLGYYRENGVYWTLVSTIRDLEEARKEYASKTDKPWGYEKILISTEKYLTKELYIRAGYQTSFHKHPRKDETMRIMSGVGYIEFEDHKEFFQKNDTIRIEPDVPHTIVATENTVLYEVSTPHLEDTVRIKDFYSVR